MDEGKTNPFREETMDSHASAWEPDATLAGGDSESASGGEREGRRFTEKVGDRIGPYLLIEEIGSGGMGTVYRAEQQKPVKREVALKIIKAGMDTDQVIARFEAERQALSMMEHPNIARVLDAGATDQGRPYFVMELVRGVAVTDFCDQQKMPIEERLQLFCKICDAIQHAHQKGIIHRDLKPSNILVSRSDGKANPKVIDFGVAKATKQRLTEKTMHTQQGQVVGTLEYMSPEQAQMSEALVDTRTDIYSLGVVLYELLIGSTPLNRQSISKLGYIDILNRIKDQDPAKPSSQLTESKATLNEIADSRSVEPRRLSSQLRGDLDWIVLKALNKEPARRYETAAGLADDVEHYLNDEPIDARPPTNWYLLNKFARRHKVAVTAGMLLLISLIAGIAFTNMQRLRAENAENRLADQMVALRKSYRLEKENALLAREVAQRNQAAKLELAQEIELLARFGRWQEMLEGIDQYRSNYGEPPLDLEIMRLDALDGLSRSTELRTEIQRLESHVEADHYRPILDLWRGYVFLAASDNETDAQSLIRGAIDSGQLNLSNEWFAKGLVDESLAGSLSCYRQALDAFPFHPQARMQMLISLIMLGRYEQVQQEVALAKTMFPNDLRYQFAEAASHCFANQRNLASQSRRKLRQQLGRQQTRYIAALERLSAAVNDQFRTYDQNGLLDWVTITRQILPLIQDTTYRKIPVAEFQKDRLSSAYGQLADSFLNPFQAFAKENWKHRDIIQNCQAAWEIHPDGMFKCFEGWSWIALQDFDKASAAFKLASQSDGLFPEVKNQALYGAFSASLARFDQTSDQAVLDEAVEFLEQHISRGFESHRAVTMFKASATAGRWDLARKITEEMIRRDGSFIFDWSMNLLNEAEKRGNLGLALSVCDEMLVNAPQNVSLQKRRERLIREIADLSPATGG